MRYGLAHGWFPLHKDGRIRGREVERRPLIEFDAPMFFSSSNICPTVVAVSGCNSPVRVGFAKCQRNGPRRGYRIAAHSRTWMCSGCTTNALMVVLSVLVGEVGAGQRLGCGESAEGGRSTPQSPGRVQQGFRPVLAGAQRLLGELG